MRVGDIHGVMNRAGTCVDGRFFLELCFLGDCRLKGGVGDLGSARDGEADSDFQPEEGGHWEGFFAVGLNGSMLWVGLMVGYLSSTGSR